MLSWTGVLEYSEGGGLRQEGQLLSLQRGDPRSFWQPRNTCFREEVGNNLVNVDGKIKFYQIPRAPSGINLLLCSAWVPLVIRGPATENCVWFSEVFPTANSFLHWKGPENKYFNNMAAVPYAFLSAKLPNFNFLKCIWQIRIGKKGDPYGQIVLYLKCLVE